MALRVLWHGVPMAGASLAPTPAAPEHVQV